MSHTSHDCSLQDMILDRWKFEWLYLKAQGIEKMKLSGSHACSFVDYALDSAPDPNNCYNRDMLVPWRGVEFEGGVLV